MNDDEFKRYLHERLESLHTQSEQTREAQLATVRAVRSLADKLTQVETHRLADDNELAKVTGAVSVMISLISQLNPDKTLVAVPIDEPHALPPPPEGAPLKKRDDEPTGAFKRHVPAKYRLLYISLAVALCITLLVAAVALGWGLVRR